VVNELTDGGQRFQRAQDHILRGNKADPVELMPMPCPTAWQIAPGRGPEYEMTALTRQPQREQARGHSGQPSPHLERGLPDRAQCIAYCWRGSLQGQRIGVHSFTPELFRQRQPLVVLRQHALLPVQLQARLRIQGIGDAEERIRPRLTR